MTRHSSEELHSLTTEFADAYDSNDIERIMPYFAEDGVFDAIDGTRSVGLQEVRTVTEQILSMGKLTFEGEDVFVDPDAQKALLQWKLHTETGGKTYTSHGLDVLHWRDGKLTLKSTFFKTERPKTFA